MKKPNAVCLKLRWLTLLLVMTVALPSWAYEKISSNKRGVRVEAKPLSLAVDQPATFQIRMSTHSVELSQDLQTVAELVDDVGRIYAPFKWEGDPPGGHHRKGQLIFPVIQKTATSITLVIRDVGNVAERKFKWQLK